MTEIVWAIGLACIPILHFVLLWYASKRNGSLDVMKRIYAIMYLDWFFVPFNFFYILAVDHSWLLTGIILVITIPFLLWLHHRWKQIAHEREQTGFFITKAGLTEPGKIHFVFMLVQSVPVLQFMLSYGQSIWYFLGLLSLLLYLVFYIFILHKLRNLNAWNEVEGKYIYLGIGVLLVRFIVSII